MELLDWALLTIWSPVVVYFLRRFARKRKLVSLGIAVMATGWLYPLWTQISAAKWVGVSAGIFVIGAIIRVERLGR